MLIYYPGFSKYYSLSIATDGSKKMGETGAGWDANHHDVNSDVPSAIAHGFGGGRAGTLGGVARGAGRVFSPVWMGYGVYLFGMETYCAVTCANEKCAY